MGFVRINIVKTDGIHAEVLKGINAKRLARGDRQALKKFRENIARLVADIVRDTPENKQKRLETFKAGAWELIAQVPVITPVVTAMFQALLGEDLGTKMDQMLDLQRKTLAVGEKTLERTERILNVLDERLPPLQ